MKDEKRKFWQKIGGEYLREASALILVFGFLDAFDKFLPLNLKTTVAIVVVSLALFVIGGILEWRSK